MNINKNYFVYLLKSSIFYRLLCVLKIFFFGGLFGKKIAFCVGFSVWKHKFLKNFFPEYKLIFIIQEKSLFIFKPFFKESIFLIWGYTENKKIEKLIEKCKVKIYRVEDGFLRSKRLGIKKSTPISLVIDEKSLHYNAGAQSSLEDFLENYKFNEREIIYSREAINFLIKNDISKYNEGVRTNALKKRGVLVVGQVETDLSIAKSSLKKPKTMIDLVKLAYEENKGSLIYYKVHPDVLSGLRKNNNFSSFDEISKYAEIISEDMSVGTTLENIGTVYTISSLLGFEALLRGKKVVCLGAPFYSGWGLTDDREKIKRRTRLLSVEEIFYAAYILYPRYVDPRTKKNISIMETLNLLR